MVPDAVELRQEVMTMSSINVGMNHFIPTLFCIH